MAHSLSELAFRFAKACDAAGEELAGVARSIGRMAGEPHEPATLSALLGWLASVQAAAPAKWYHPDSPRTCEVQVRSGPCARPAAGRCVVCGRDVCLPHAAISIQADLVCAACCARAKASLGRNRRQHEAPPNAWDPPNGERSPVDRRPSELELREAYAVLGLEPGASWEEVERRVRKLRVKYHPDRQKSGQEKAASEAKFKRVGEAYELIARATSSR